jgi:hypothetical protein
MNRLERTLDELLAKGISPAWAQATDPRRVDELLAVMEQRELTPEESAEFDRASSPAPDAPPPPQDFCDRVMGPVRKLIAEDQRRRVAGSGARGGGKCSGTGTDANVMATRDSGKGLVNTRRTISPQFPEFNLAARSGDTQQGGDFCNDEQESQSGDVADAEWIDAQRIGLFASCCIAYRGNYTLWDGRVELLDLVGQFSKSLHTLPPQVLHLIDNALVDLDDEGATQIRMNVKKALTRLYGDDDKNDSPIHFGMVIAHNILNGTVRPTAFTKLCRAVATGRRNKGNWRPAVHNENLAAALTKPFEVLRSPDAQMMDRVKAITELSRLLGEYPWWCQARNALYRHVLCWPLLIVDINRNGPAVAVSLPVAVDVDFEPAGSPTRPFRMVPENDLRFRGWEPHLWKAVDSAKELWRATHSNYGSFCSVVRESVAIFDFRLALKILGNCATCMKDGSAESYFSQVVLNRFLGRRLSLSSVATGEIGRRIRINVPAGFKVEVPTDLVASRLVEWQSEVRCLTWRGVWTGNTQEWRLKLRHASTDTAWQAAVDHLFDPQSRETELVVLPPGDVVAKLNHAIDSQIERFVLPHGSRAQIKEVYRTRADVHDVPI